MKGMLKTPARVIASAQTVSQSSFSGQRLAVVCAGGQFVHIVREKRGNSLVRCLFEGCEGSGKEAFASMRQPLDQRWHADQGDQASDIETGRQQGCFGLDTG